MVLYATAADAWARILERRWGVAADEPYALELLALSAGIDAENVLHFRAWYVGAKLIEQNLTTQAVTEADGAKLTRLQPVIDSLLQQQRSYDQENSLTVPKGYEAISAECDGCGGLSSGESVSGARRPRSIRTKVVR